MNLRRWSFEVVAILGSILAAFAIDAAWDARNDRARADDYLEALQAEMAMNLRIARAQQEQLDGDLPDIQQYYELFFSRVGSEVDAEDVVALVAELGPRRVEFERAALTDLVSSGGVQFVEDPTIRRGISAYDRQLAETASNQEQLGVFWADAIVPYFIEYGDLPATFSRFVRFPNDWSFPESPTPLDVTAFVSDRRFQNLVANYLYWMTQIRREVVDLDRTITSLDSLVAARR